jgi:TonB family protein
MKKSIQIILLMIITSSAILSQNVIEKKYYKSKYGGTSVSENKGKVVEITIQEADSTLRYELRDLKDNNLIALRFFKNGIPVGKWHTIYGEELNYDFELEYSSIDYSQSEEYNLPDVKNGVNFQEAKFPMGDGNFNRYILQKLVYPTIAAEKGIQGKVICQFIIDENGKPIQFSVLKGVDKNLDKEAIRVLRLSPDWIPAKLNGNPVKTSKTFPFTFTLQ